MNVGIIKLWFSLPGRGAKVNQTTSWAHEVWKFCDVLNDLGHKVFIMSDVRGESFYQEWNKESLDVVFVFNSKKQLEDDDSVEKKFLFDRNVLSFYMGLNQLNKTKKVYVVTDLLLRDFALEKICSKVISQGDIGEYIPIEQAPLLNKFLKTNKNALERVVYLGNERDNNRTLKLLFYFKHFKEKLDIYGSWRDPRITKLKTFKGPIPFEESQKLLNKYLFALMITDKEYEENNFVTPRYYETLSAGCLPICDRHYDKKNKIKGKVFADDVRADKKTYKKLFGLTKKAAKDNYSLKNELNRFLEELK